MRNAKPVPGLKVSILERLSRFAGAPWGRQ
jgi:hypothetical protein